MTHDQLNNCLAAGALALLVIAYILFIVTQDDWP